MFCGKCGNKNPDENKFCAGCGTSLQTIQDSVEETRNEIVEKVETLQNEEKLKNLEEAKEKVYYRGEGELIVRTTKHHGTGRKVASFVAGAGVGYLIAGRDSKRTTKSKGSIVVTNQSILNHLKLERTTHIFCVDLTPTLPLPE